MSNIIKRMQKKLRYQEKYDQETQQSKEEITVHGAMKYQCGNCRKEWWMFLEKGIEEFGDKHKPSPFIITCKCGGAAKDISGIIKFPSGNYELLPEGESYFANVEDSDCGVPVLR